MKTIEKINRELISNIKNLEYQNKKLEIRNIELLSELLKTQENLESSINKNLILIKKLDENKKIKNDYQKLELSIAKVVKKENLNTIKQIESFISLNNYLNNNLLPLSYHGWPISSDLALFLTQKIEENSYDLIIEFGSGTSTLLFAKMIEKKGGKLIAFEHKKEYLTKTKESLKHHNLYKNVEVVYAPLIEYIDSDESETFLYYNCKEKLDFNGYNNILVLIDGPPESTGPLARLPALKHILNNKIGSKRIDLVLDDHNRTNEKEISRKWEDYLNSKNITFYSESIINEKGLYFCQINKELRNDIK